MIPTQKCPYCNRPADAADDAFGNAKPSPGDLAICIGCAGVQVFDDALLLQRYNGPIDDDTRVAVQRVRRAVLRIGIDGGKA